MLNVTSRLVLCASLFLLWPSSGRADDLTLAWDPPEGPAPAGYLLRYRALTSSVLTNVDAGTRTTLQVSSLTPGTTYEFYVVAYDAARLYSGPSNLVRVTIPGDTPAPPPPPPPPPSVVTTTYFPAPDDTAAVPDEPFRAFLAEGAVSNTFDTHLMLANPGRTPATATVYLRREGDDRSHVGKVLVPALGQVEADVEAIVGGASGAFGIGVTSSARLGISRTMSWDAGVGVHAEAGTAAPAARWYFAEGASSDRYALFYHLLNPGKAATTVAITYLRPSGPPIVRHHVLPGRSRTTIAVDQEGPELTRTEVATVVESLDRQPIVVERAMYLVGRAGYLGGHAALGVTTPRTHWLLAEGVTGGEFSTDILLANPGDRSALVELRFRDVDGLIARTRVEVPAFSRRTFAMADLDPRLGSTAVWTEVLSLYQVPIVAERATWWSAGRGDGHATNASARPAMRWLIVGAEHGGVMNAAQSLVMANPAGSDQQVRLTVLGPDGPVGSTRVGIRAWQRLDVDMETVFPGVEGPYGVLVETVSGDGGVVVEQSQYRDPDGDALAAGASSRAIPLDQ